MVGVEKEERLATPWLTSLRLRIPGCSSTCLPHFSPPQWSASSKTHRSPGDLWHCSCRCSPVSRAIPAGQALAVTLRGLTLGELKPGAERALVTKEAWLGCLNGAGVGCSAGVGMYITATGQESAHPVMLALVVFLAMVGSCIASALPARWCR